MDKGDRLPNNGNSNPVFATERQSRKGKPEYCFKKNENICE